MQEEPGPEQVEQPVPQAAQTAFDEPEQYDTVYEPVPQTVHALHCVSCESPHAWLAYWPAGHVLQAEHTVSVVAEQDCEINSPLAHDEHARQTVSAMATHRHTRKQHENLSQQYSNAFRT